MIRGVSGLRWILGAMAVLVLTAGCEPDFWSEDDSDDGDSGNEAASIKAEAQPAEDGEVAAEPQAAAGPHIVFLGTDVSGWPETSRLNASIEGDMIRLDYDKANTWPAKNGVNANAWIIVNQGGQLYAATFEWLKRGQTTKPLAVINGNHIKKSPLNDFRPRSGETYGFFVSGLARDSTRNVEERTNIDFIRWP